MVSVALISLKNKKSPRGLCPDAHISDGVGHLLAVKRCGRANYLSFLMQVSKGGRQLERDNVVHIPIREVRFTPKGDRLSSFNMDGELVPPKALHVRVLPGAIRVFARGPELEPFEREPEVAPVAEGPKVGTTCAGGLSPHPGSYSAVQSNASLVPQDQATSTEDLIPPTVTATTGTNTATPRLAVCQGGLSADVLCRRSSCHALHSQQHSETSTFDLEPVVVPTAEVECQVEPEPVPTAEVECQVEPEPVPTAEVECQVEPEPVV